MFKKLITTIAAMAGLVAASNANAQAVYNSIATAYVTTTISQSVVFDSTMQQGGTFTFSVLAHNGGGRAGQSDTANVKIEFYNGNNQLVSTVNTSYSGNLPNPTALGGNPQIDPAVPWTTLSVSSTNCGGSCATVAYAKVSMYGIDGSYWAGDYGPWYRAPTLTLNGGNNLVYNPEFGPYNNITAQGWTASPGFGACQGAWGGSNACIVNSSGTPGTSTVGLVANQNGGGPSATGGTTSGQAGGYNSTMNVSNPSGAPAATTSTNANGTTIATSLGQTTDSSITNNGTINVGGTDAGISATTATTTTITNGGTITTNNGSGINAQQSSSTSANVTITNSGTITANTSGATNGNNTYSAHGILASFNGTGSTGTATVNNTSTGTITVTNGDGVIINGYGHGILNNDGSITATPTGTNSMPGVLVGNNGIINNNGSITGDVGVDFLNSTAGSNINNRATGTITGNSGLAIVNLGTNNTGASVNNFGIINGDVQLSTNGTYNLVGNGSQVGAIRTTDATGSTNVNIGVSAAPTNATLQGNIGDTANTSAPIGTYGNFPRAFTFQTIGNVTIDATSSLTDNTGYTISANTVTNNGTFVSGNGTTTINGAFVNNGVFSTTYNGPSYSQVAVNGGLTLGSGATYVPVIVGGQTTNVTLNSPYTSIISASGGITGAFVATSGSIGNINWAITQNGNQIDMLWTPSVTVVGTAPGNPIVVNTVTNGSTTTTTSVANGTPTQTATIVAGTPTTTVGVGINSSNSGNTVSVARTVTTTVSTPYTTTVTTDVPVTTTTTDTTPITTVTDTTPTTVTTYSDGSTTTANGSTVTTTNTTNQVVSTDVITHQVSSSSTNGTQVVATPVTTTKTANVAGAQDSINYQNQNLFLIDPFTTPDGSWVTPSYNYGSVSGGNIGGTGIAFGYQKSVGDYTAGVAGSYGSTQSANYNNSSSTATSGSGTAYVLSKKPWGALMVAGGVAYTDHSNNVNIPEFGLMNNQKAKQTNVYGDVAYYSPILFNGWQPFAGVTVNNSSVSDGGSSGSAILAQSISTGSKTTTMPYGGVQYTVSKDVALQAKVSQSPIYGTVASGKAIIKKEIAKNTYLNASIGYESNGKDYNNAKVMVGLTIDF